MVPAMLKIFFVADASQVSSFFENRLRSLDDGETNLDSILTKRTINTNHCRRETYDYLTRRNAEHCELIPSFLSESIELENDRKKNIHAIVTTIMAFAVPLIAFIYALLFQENSQKSDPSTKKRISRKERILRDLVECRIQLPITPKSDDIATRNQEGPQECPICLSTFTEGQVVIAPKRCHCSIPIANNGREKVVPVAEDTNAGIEPKYRQHQTHPCCFHESCILKWLSHRKINPKKLCPCCRQPFFGGDVSM